MDSKSFKKAIDKHNLNRVNYLLKKCGNVNEVVIDDGNSQTTPLRYAIRHQILCRKTERCKIDEIMLRLISAGADVNVALLVFALNFHTSDEIVCRLISIGLNLNEGCPPNDDSPLMTAIKNRYSKRVIDSFIHAGADVNYSNLFRKTTLEYALSSGSQPEICMTLIHAGADVRTPSSSGGNYFFQLISKYCDDSNCCEYREIINLFLNRGVDIKEVDEDGNNILHLSNCQYLTCVAVDNGIPVDSVNDDGFTPLMFAILRTNINILKKLLLLNADPNRIISMPDRANVNEFFYIDSDFVEVLNLLVYHGADLYSRDCRTSLNEFLIRSKFYYVEECLEAIIKHLLLFFDENSLNVFFYNSEYQSSGIIKLFAKKCKAELKKMRRSFLKGSLSFYQFCNLKRNYKSKIIDIPCGEFNYNCKQINKLFAIYKDLIIMRIKDYKVEVLEKVLRKSLQWIIVRSFSDHETNAGEQLNYDCLHHVAYYLDNKQIYNLFLASIHD